MVAIGQEPKAVDTRRHNRLFFDDDGDARLFTVSTECLCHDGCCVTKSGGVTHGMPCERGEWSKGR